MSKLLQSFKPVFCSNAEYLILGSMPGQASLDVGQYYAHPRNQFWALVLGCRVDQVPAVYQERIASIVRLKVALWDSLKYCQRSGSLDSAIVKASEEVNDFAYLFKQLPQLKCICFNGKKSEQIFRAYVQKPGLVDLSAYQLICLPSSSPANAAMSFAYKAELWADALNRSQ